MKKIILFNFLLLLFGNSWAQNFRPNHVHVKLKSGYKTAWDAQAEYFQKLGCTRITQKYPTHRAEGLSSEGFRLIDLSLWYDVEVDNSRSVLEWCKLFQKETAIAVAEPIFIHELMYTPNDPSIPSLIGSSMWWLTKLDALNAWNINKGNPSLIIGISDTGFDLDHPELGADLFVNSAEILDGIDNDGNGKVDDINGWDFVGASAAAPFGDNNPTVTASGNKHGVNVSGLAAARADNGVGLCSPAFQVKWMPLKIMADNGGSLLFGYESIIYGADLGCTAINCSWGGNNYSQFGQDAVSYACINKNCAVVAAAGNTYSDIKFYPAAYDHVLSVTGTISGDTQGSVTYNYTVDVSAPCRNIYLVQYDNTYTTTVGACYTSYAAPFATSTLALIKSQYPAYHALQLMERLRVTSDDVYALNPPILKDKIGKGRINMYKALTMVTPAFRQENLQLSDSPDAGKTINLSMDFRNYLDPSIHAEVSLSTTHPDITILSPHFTIGAVSTLNTLNNNLSPFVIQISPTAAMNQEVFFKLTYTDPLNSYSDFEYFSILINPEFENITTNLLHTTANARGNIGYNDFNVNRQGLGILYNGSTETWLYESGFLIGRSSTQVSDRIRNPAVQDSDFSVVSPFRQQIPGLFSDADGFTAFQDTQATKLGVGVHMHSYVWNEPNHQNYIIFQYTIQNTGVSALTNVYAGLFADWDLPPYNTNRSAYDSVSKTVFAFNADSIHYAGIRLLTWDSLHVRSLTSSDPFNYSSAAKYSALSQGTALSHTGPNDIMHFISTGPFIIQPGDSHTVAFALLAGDSWTHIQNGGDSALAHYACKILAAQPHLSFNPAALYLTEATNVSLDCQKYTDHTISLHLDTPSMYDTQILLFPDSSSSADSMDFQIFPSSVIFIPAGTVGDIPITLRIFDDAIEELTEKIVLKYKFISRKDVAPDCSNQTLTIQLTDNDAITPPYLIENNFISVTEHIGPYQKVWFKNPSTGGLVACIENLDAHDYGCTEIKIDRIGVGAIAFQQPILARFATEKTYLVKPEQNLSNGNYHISLFYTDAELMGWEAITGNVRTDLNILKSAGAIANVSPAHPGANGWTNVMGENPIFQTINTSDAKITATFHTGFSGFAAAKDGSESPLPIVLSSFEGKTLAQSNQLQWHFTTTEAITGQLQKKKENQGYETIYSWITQEQEDYIFEDQKPEVKENYRLLVQDWNGQSTVLGYIELIREPSLFYMQDHVLHVLDTGKFNILDLTGRTVFQAQGSQEIDTQSWSSSLYFIHFLGSGKVATFKP